MALSNNPIGGDLNGIQWENLENLEFLDLSNTDLTGKIPDSLTELKRLRFLGLINNSLSGNISPRFEDMPCISALYLNGNNFTGEIGFSVSFMGKWEVVLGYLEIRIFVPLLGWWDKKCSNWGEIL